MKKQTHKDKKLTDKLKRYWGGYILVPVLAYALVFALLCLFLFIHQLMFRQWMYIFSAFLIVFGGIAGVCQLIFKLKKKACKIAGAIFFAIFLYYFIPVLFVASAFSYTPEYVIVKDGHKYVAYVNSFLKTRVFYYDYKNFLVAGSQKKLEEFYGKSTFFPDDAQMNEKNVKSVVYF